MKGALSLPVVRPGVNGSENKQPAAADFPILGLDAPSRSPARKLDVPPPVNINVKLV